jgi:alpha-N-acetylglucosamine transferase
MIPQLNWNNKIIEIQIISSIVRVSEHFSKMLVLSGVFNARILDATNYANQHDMRVNYTLIVVYAMLLVTSSQSKNVSCFCLDMAQ